MVAQAKVITADTIRRDVWSIKEWDYSVGDYVHTHMFYSADSAFRYKRNNPKLHLRVVHPAAWIVVYFVAVGNTIYH